MPRPASLPAGRRVAAILAMSAFPAAAVADIVAPIFDWSRSQIVTYDDIGVSLYFSFQPTRPQDGIDPTQVEVLDDLTVRQSVGVDSGLFQEIPEEEELQMRPVFTLLLGAIGPEGPPGWGPGPDPVPDAFEQLEFDLDIGSQTLTARLGFRTFPDDPDIPDPDDPDDGPGGIGLGTELEQFFFNPQPEPPALSGLGDSFGFDFTFTGFSTATVDLTLLDETGVAIAPTRIEALTPIPLPPAALLLAGGVAALGWMRRRRPA